MTLKFEWKEFVDLFMIKLRELNPNLELDEPVFMTIYEDGPPGTMYVYPSYVEVKSEPKESA